MVPGVRHVGAWTVDFRANVAYIRLPRGDKALRSDDEGRLGIIDIYMIPAHVRKVVKYPSTWEEMETLPFVETFGSREMILR